MAKIKQIIQSSKHLGKKIDDMDDLYDLDIENDSYDDSDYDSYRAAYEEEQAAYDDYIASLDMDD